MQSWGSGSNSGFNISPIIRPYTARAFTYAEKIEMMKQQNDFDSEFVAKHLGVTSSSSSAAAPSTTSTSSDGGATAAPSDGAGVPLATSPSVLLLQQQHLHNNNTGGGVTSEKKIKKSPPQQQQSVEVKEEQQAGSSERYSKSTNNRGSRSSETRFSFCRQFESIWLLFKNLFVLVYKLFFWRLAPSDNAEQK